MAGNGGARPGSGAKKNQHRIHAGELRKALEDKLGMPYVEMLAETQLKLFNDFKIGENTKEYITFTENMSRRILVDQASEVQISNVSELTKDQIDDKIANLLTRLALSEKPKETQDYEHIDSCDGNCGETCNTSLDSPKNG